MLSFYETFAKPQFWSLRGTKCRGNLMSYQYVMRLLRFARNDNMGILPAFFLHPLERIGNVTTRVDRFKPALARLDAHPRTIALNVVPGVSTQWDREARSGPGVYGSRLENCQPLNLEPFRLIRVREGGHNYLK